MLRAWVERVGIGKATFIIVIASVLISVTIAVPSHLLASGSVPIVSLAVSVLAPAAISGPFSFLSLNLYMQLKAAHDEVRRLSVTDDLTGVYNRRHFFEHAQQELARVRRYGGVFSIVMLDVDDFKKVNDTYGHLVGDTVLQTVAGICADLCRGADIFARFGGEEFIFLLTETREAGALVFAERVRRTVAQTPIGTSGAVVRLTVSLGVSAYREGDVRLASVIGRADGGVYRAKSDGKNCIGIG